MIGTICSDKMSLNLSDSNSSVGAVVVAVAVAVAASIFYFLIFSHRFLFASSFLPLVSMKLCVACFLFFSRSCATHRVRVWPGDRLINTAYDVLPYWIYLVLVFSAAMRMRQFRQSALHSCHNNLLYSLRSFVRSFTQHFKYIH